MVLRTCSVLLLAVAAMATGCSQINPIGPGFIYEPDEREQRLWESSRNDSAVIRAKGGLYDDPALHDYVNRVLARLLGEYKNAYLPLRPRVFVLDSPVINALASPHGDIFINTGILGRLRNEAHLAMLLGHEITHATHRHAYQHLEDKYARTGANSYIAVISSIGGSNVQSAISGLSDLITMAAVSGYGRKLEEESDRVGLTLIAQAGYAPHRGAEMFQRMLDATDPKKRQPSLFYATHPRMKKRVASSRKLIPRMPSELLENAKEIGQDRYLDHAIDLIHGEVERHIVQGKYKLAEETLKFLADARPQDANSYAYLGELRRSRADAGDEEHARAAYKRAIELNPRLPMALRGLGLICLKQGEKNGAADYLNAYLAEARNAPDVDYIRAIVQKLRRE